MAKKKDENKRVIFRRVGGRVIPITLAGGAALEASRRKTVYRGQNLVVKQRKSIFTRTTTLKAIRSYPLLNSSRVVGKAVFQKQKKNRAKIKYFEALDKRSAPALFSSMNKSAKKQKIKFFNSIAVNPRVADITKARKGKLLSISKSGVRFVGARAAKGEITRARKGYVRAGIKAIMKVK